MAKLLKKKVLHKAKPQTAPVKKQVRATGPEFNQQIVHQVCRAVYIDGLHRGGSPEHKMTDEKIDANCSFYGAVVRAALRELIVLGLLNEQDLK